MVRATIYIPDDQLWRDFRSACIQRDKSASEIIATYVARQVAAWNDDHDIQTQTEQSESEPAVCRG